MTARTGLISSLLVRCRARSRLNTRERYFVRPNLVCHCVFLQTLASPANELEVPDGDCLILFCRHYLHLARQYHEVTVTSGC